MAGRMNRHPHRSRYGGLSKLGSQSKAARRSSANASFSATMGGFSIASAWRTARNCGRSRPRDRSRPRHSCSKDSATSAHPMDASMRSTPRPARRSGSTRRKTKSSAVQIGPTRPAPMQNGCSSGATTFPRIASMPRPGRSCGKSRPRISSTAPRRSLQKVKPSSAAATRSSMSSP